MASCPLSGSVTPFGPFVPSPCQIMPYQLFAAGSQLSGASIMPRMVGSRNTFALAT